MTNTEIHEALARLQESTAALEAAYEENGGEITEDTERLEAEKEMLRQLLTTEGVDALGRWLKSKEDESKTIKAEADYIARQRKAIDNSIDYVKGRIVEVLTACGTDKVKGGCGYSFTLSKSITTSVNKQALQDKYQELAEKALREAGIPSWVTVKLDASVNEVPEGAELPDVFQQTTKDSVTFRKPRAAKEAE